VIPKALLPHEVLFHAYSIYCAFFIYLLYEILELIKPHLQISGETIGEVKEVADMHQRKAEMAKHADAFIAIPGRISWLGTLPHCFFTIFLCIFQLNFQSF